MVLNGKVNILFLKSVSVYPLLIIINVNNGNYQAILGKKEYISEKKITIIGGISRFVTIFVPTKKQYDEISTCIQTSVWAYRLSAGTLIFT